MKAAIFHCADDLVSRYYRQCGGMDVALDCMEICVTYTAYINAHEDLIFPGYWNRQINAFKRIVLHCSGLF